MVIFYKSDFSEGKNAGGATGSVQASHINQNWKGQVKPSIKSKGFFSLRRRKVGGLDVENFGELIGAKIALGNNQSQTYVGGCGGVSAKPQGKART